MNYHSEILWKVARVLYEALEKDGIGVAGATGS